jgi:transcriptional regulator with XRE-family HTH domain
MASMPVSPQDALELAATEHWRGLMKRARIAHGLTQEQLGDAVNVSQNVISGLESGAVRSSKAIAAISSKLKIPLPHAMVMDDLEQRWIDAGRVLRARADRSFETLLRTAEELAEQYSTNPDES